MNYKPKKEKEEKKKEENKHKCIINQAPYSQEIITVYTFSSKKKNILLRYERSLIKTNTNFTITSLKLKLQRIAKLIDIRFGSGNTIDNVFYKHRNLGHNVDSAFQEIQLTGYFCNILPI